MFIEGGYVLLYELDKTPLNTPLVNIDTSESNSNDDQPAKSKKKCKVFYSRNSSLLEMTICSFETS